MSIQFQTRVPATKTSVNLEVTGFQQSEKKVVLIGRAAVAGGTVDTGAGVTILNFGDEALAKTECDGYFGADSELGEMVVAAIKALRYSDLPSKVFPKIVCYPMDNGDDDLETFLEGLVNEPMPHVAIPFDMSSSSNLTAFKLHLEVISGDNRGHFGQFGSFGHIGDSGEFATLGPIAEAQGTQHFVFPWLRDAAAVKANKVHEVAAAQAIIAAALPAPYNPVNGIRVGKIAPPSDKADHHTGGETGTVSLGLDSGLVPWVVDDAGEVRISRLITSLRSNAVAADQAYYDVNDWQVLYEYRYNCYLISEREQYKNQKRTATLVQALKSEFFQLALDFQTLGMFQEVEAFADQFTAEAVAGNRHAVIFKAPVNVVPGLHQKGIEITGTNQFDVLSF